MGPWTAIRNREIASCIQRILRFCSAFFFDSLVRQPLYWLRQFAHYGIPTPNKRKQNYDNLVTAT
jgi:hypothetical protein